jgi:tetraacyldisaccharide 4'-kinase
MALKQEKSGFIGILLAGPYIFYRAIVAIRNWFYNREILKPYRVEAKVISIGGLSFGGAGKTPLTIHLAKIASKHPEIRKIAIISCGYRRKSSGTLLVADGYNLTTTVQSAGDELFLIAKNVPTAVVVADQNRYRGACFALERFQVDTIILDDAFQHRSLHRNFDIVLIETEIILKPEQFFLREQLPALKRADIIMVLDAETAQRDVIERKLREFSPAAIFFGRRRAEEIKSNADDKTVSIEKLSQLKAFAFCALAHPQRFWNSLKGLGLNPINFLAFPDHCDYNEGILAKILEQSPEAEILLTSAKDAVKLPPVIDYLPVYYLDLDIEIENEGRLREKIFQK